MAVAIKGHEPFSEILKRIPTKKLTTIAEVVKLVADQELNPVIGRYRSSYLYRGIPVENLYEP